MPFSSEKQRRYLFSQKPEVAKKFVEHSGGKVVIKKKANFNCKKGQ